MGNNSKKTFIRITNQDIYKEIIELKRIVEKIVAKTQTNEQAIKWLRGALIFISSIILTLMGYILTK
jgi:hypoxanthine-guanine phosphoribosyltransferase